MTPKTLYLCEELKVSKISLEEAAKNFRDAGCIKAALMAEAHATAVRKAIALLAEYVPFDAETTFTLWGEWDE